MHSIHQIKKKYVIGSFVAVIITLACKADVDFDELLDRTMYAQLLKELICMTDTVGLLKHQIDKDERRFIEDSILGKMVRVKRLLVAIDAAHVSTEDVSYLCYWLELAQHEELSLELLDEMHVLHQKIIDHFHTMA